MIFDTTGRSKTEEAFVNNVSGLVFHNLIWFDTSSQLRIFTCSVSSEPKVERPKPTKRTGDLPSKDVSSKSSEPKTTRESKRQQPNTNMDTGKESNIRAENSSKVHTTDAISTHIPTSKSATEKSPVSENVNKDTSAKVSSKQSKESEIDRTVKNQGDVPCDLPKFTCVLVEKLTRNVNKVSPAKHQLICCCSSALVD